MKTQNNVQPTDEELKAAFIAKNGVTKCPTPSELAPVPVREAADEPEPQKAFKPISTDAGEKPTLFWVDVAELHINQTYQRSVSSKRGQAVIKSIVEHFKWNFFQPVTLTQREEGGYWVIDGQHRMMAAGQRGIDKIPAVLMHGLSDQDQARSFVGINARRVAVTPQAMHHALIAAGDPERVALQKCCEQANVVIPRYPKPLSRIKPNETSAISTLLMVIKIHGSETLIKILRSIRQVHPDTPGMINRKNIQNRIDRCKPKTRSFEDE